MLSADELYEIMINLDGHDLQSLCSVSSDFNHLCQNPDFWKNKLRHDHLPLFNDPSSVIDYIKIKAAYDVQLKYESQSYLMITFTNQDLSLILPSTFYNQIKKLDYDQVELYLHYFKQSNMSTMINYKALKNNKRIEVKMMKLTREEVLDVIFKIAYYYPDLI